MTTLYGDFEQAYAENHLVRLIGRTRPDVIVRRRLTVRRDGPSGGPTLRPASTAPGGPLRG